MSTHINPQPQSSGQSVDLGHLTETVTAALSRAKAGGLVLKPRIIIGLIIEPHGSELSEGAQSAQ
jgi:hypothetical protein